jgi:hypothetical protein
VIFPTALLASIPLLAATPFTAADTSRAPGFVPRRLAEGVYVVPGDTGRGSEGRPNAGFIVTAAGVVVVDALASPREGEGLLRAIRARAARPRWWPTGCASSGST